MTLTQFPSPNLDVLVICDMILLILCLRIILLLTSEKCSLKVRLSSLGHLYREASICLWHSITRPSQQDFGEENVPECALRRRE